MATLKSTVDVEAACHTVSRSLGYSALKPEQLSVIKSFVCGKDVFAVLPTGFGKSLSAILDRVRGCSGSIVVVVSPLNAIMKDQVTK